MKALQPVCEIIKRKQLYITNNVEEDTLQIVNKLPGINNLARRD